MEGLTFDLQQDGRPTSIDAVEPPTKLFVPWVDGRLLHYFSPEEVLDIKAPNDPDRGPVVAGATVAFFSETTGDAVLSSQSGSVPDASNQSFRTLFSRDALGLARDPSSTLATWFDLLRTGGNLIIVLPANVCPEEEGVVHGPAASSLPQASAVIAPSSLGALRPAVHQASLLRVVEAALTPGTFRVILLDQSPARRSDVDGAALDLRLVLQKLPTAETALPDVSDTTVRADLQPNVADLSMPFTSIQPTPVKTPGMRYDNGLLVRDFATQQTKVARILVLKLDHHGDFVIGLPALTELRENYPGAYIRLVCGSWNVSSAAASGLFDDVRTFNYFPERAVEWIGVSASTGWSLFDKAAEGSFDLAIDLRVDDDTRSLLARVDARLRCGIGSIARFPLLDVALPDSAREPTQIALSAHGNFSLTPDGAQVLEPGDFLSCMDFKTAAYHESVFKSVTGPLLKSSTFFLPRGSYSVSFNLSAHSFVPGLRGTGVKIEVVADGERTVASKVFGRRSISRISSEGATLHFESSGRPSTYEFLVITEGRPLIGRLRFAGLRLRRHDANGARFSPSELHVGEKLSLLVNLIRQRTLSLYPQPANSSPATLEAGAESVFVISPFSNSTIRDWPTTSYAELIKLLLDRFACKVVIIGSPAQAAQAAGLMAQLDERDNGSNLVNKVGQTKWSDLQAILKSASLVICNNSGIAHQAAHLGVRTLAIYSASHQPSEWGPRGEHSRAVMVSVACSPCGYERIADCVNDHLCMRLITPEAIVGQVEAMLSVEAATSLAHL